MKAELFKFKMMPTPRRAAYFLLGLILLAVVLIWQTGPGDASGNIDIVLVFPTAIVSIILGSWIIGLEYGQNTIRRTLSADPGRLRLMANKLAAVLLLIILGTTLLFLIAYLVFNLADGNTGAYGEQEMFSDSLISALISNVVLAVIAFSITTLFSSMTGGLVFTVVFFLVADTLFMLIPKIGEYSLGIALSDISYYILERGDSFQTEPTHSALTAALTLLVWVVVAIALAVTKFLRTDVK